MKLVITTPEMLEEIIKTTLNNAMQEFYTNKESAKEKRNHYTIKEAADELNVHPLTIRNYIERGILKANKIGRRVLVTSDSLMKSLSEVKSQRYKR